MKNPAANSRVSACKQSEHSVIARTLSITKGSKTTEAISKRRDRFAIARDDSGDPVAS
jgi:hypothetical protein